MGSVLDLSRLFVVVRDVPMTGDCSPKATPSAVAKAQTWLLGPGWRRAGLIDPNEIPGALRV